jgi:hypothetical protein
MEPPHKRQVHYSNISQSYPYSSESEEARSAAVSQAVSEFEGLGDRIAAESTPLGEVGPADHGAPAKWWIWVCPKDVEGRLHVAGYARDRHAMFTVCDRCGSTFLR